MAVRKDTLANRTDSAAEWLILSLDEELRKRGVETPTTGNLARKWLKGALATLIAIVGVLVVRWGSVAHGLRFWLGSAVGLAVMATGFVYGSEFLKSLLAGELSKETLNALKDTVMKEWMKVFLAFLSIGAGTSVIVTADQLDYYVPEWVLYCIGLILIAGGITFFWTRSKFYKS